MSTWRAMAADRGVHVRTVDIHDDGTLDLDDLDRALATPTRLVAVGYASNALGTINPVAEIVRRAHAAGAWTYVDAVAYAPHGPIDVKALDTEFLVSSAYKWYGPHAGALYGKRDDPRVAAAPTRSARPTTEFETGHPELRGDRRDRRRGRLPRLARRSRPASRRAPRVGRGCSPGWTRDPGPRGGLHARLMAGLKAIPGVHIWGITDEARFAAEKAPTISVTIDGITPRDAAAALGAPGHLHVGRRLLRPGADRAARPVRERAACCASGSPITTPRTRSTACSRRSRRSPSGRGPRSERRLTRT